VLYGSITRYNDARGYLFKLGPTGTIAATFDFGWDSTPAVFGDPDSSLHVVWKFADPTTDGDHPDGFEWCINAPAVDRDGTVYANSEDGKAYAINPDGTLRDSIDLARPLGAAYTPLALDHVGHLITLNAGHLYVLGTP
jgi:outer membrane protein assembly factor BamB